jgi:hypothetical protein
MLSLIRYSDAGSCADHIKLLEIANIQSDGGDFLIRSNNFKVGSGFGWRAPCSSTFRISASQNTDFKRNPLSEMLTAKAESEVVYPL